MKIAGLDRLQRELKEAQTALADLDGELGSVTFDPNDPSSIDAAIRTMENVVDNRVGRYASNSIVAPLIEGAKESFREAILEKAAAARLGDGGDE